MQSYTYDGKRDRHPIDPREMLPLRDSDGIILMGVLRGLTLVEMAEIGAGSAASSVQYRVENVLIPLGFVARARYPETDGLKRYKNRARGLVLTEKGLAVLLDKRVAVPVGTPYVVPEAEEGAASHGNFRITRRRSRRHPAAVPPPVEPGDERDPDRA